MKLYLSGWQGGTLPREKRLLDAGITHRCVTFVNVCKTTDLPSYYIRRIVTGYEHSLTRAGVMLDSGVFSLRAYIRRMAAQGTKIEAQRDRFIREYVEFCKENTGVHDFQMTVDFEPKAPDILKIHRQIEKMGVRTVPAFHGDSEIGFLGRYLDRGYRFVAIGCNSHYVKHKRRHLDAVFNYGAKHGMTFHGLAVTAPWAILNYPFASVDSSSWSRVAAVGGIMKFDPHTRRMSVLHVSTRSTENGRASANSMTAAMRDRLRDELKAQGADLDILAEDFVERHIWNALAMQQLAAMGAKQQAGWRALV